jgi:hypothetical protein
LRDLNAEQLRAKPGESELEAVINSYELAWRMQGAAPQVLDLAGETEATRLSTASARKTPTISAANVCSRGGSVKAVCALCR